MELEQDLVESKKSVTREKTYQQKLENYFF